MSKLAPFLFHVAIAQVMAFSFAACMGTAQAMEISVIPTHKKPAHSASKAPTKAVRTVPLKVKATASSALAQPTIVKSLMPVNRLPVVLDLSLIHI